MSLPEMNRPRPGSEVPGGVRSYASPEPRRDVGRLVREVLGLLLVLLGAAAVAVAAWVFDWRAGLAVTGAVTAAAGVLLGLQP